ncbi:hypothetical protein [Ancylobacter vacuolatus]|uniref:Uncharacterized protein n=1 Tax=Ancylobacter vacuolatus TaxID=223389 RepID=A0ABU0DLX5_9HYPH|nr:hypothetical protein [Ancylobacter vacuolatus]MDQ0349400.1 hypothetical protein [Ancylobacter vacuolatus]
MSDLEQRVAALEKALADLLRWQAEYDAADAAAMERYRAIDFGPAVDEACLLAGLDPVDR